MSRSNLHRSLTTVLQVSVCVSHIVLARLQLAACKAINKWKMNSMRPKTQFPPHVQQRCANKTLIAPAQAHIHPASAGIVFDSLFYLGIDGHGSQLLCVREHRRRRPKSENRLNDLIGGVLFPSISRIGTKLPPHRTSHTSRATICRRRIICYKL